MFLPKPMKDCLIGLCAWSVPKMLTFTKFGPADFRELGVLRSPKLKMKVLSVGMLNQDHILKKD